MFMTAEEGQRNEPLSRNTAAAFKADPHKPLDYHHQHRNRTEFVKFGGKNFSGDGLTIPKSFVSPKPGIGNYDSFSTQTADKSFHQDDGYSTDSKSNTSPSTASPLSSSFSSLSTFDGSFSAHTPTGGGGGGTTPGVSNLNYSTMPGNTQPHHQHQHHQQQQRNPVQKHSLIQGNGKIHVNRHAIMAAKKKDVPQEMLDSPANLEDRLRALTTIEEEPGMANVTGNVDNSSFPPHHPGHHPTVVAGQQGFEGQGQATSTANSGFFRAVPVEVIAPQVPHDQRQLRDNFHESNPSLRAGKDEIGNSYLSGGSQPLQHSYDKNWHDYKRYFEKDCDIPIHNIDFSNANKFVGTESDNVPDKNINRQLASNSQSPRINPSIQNVAPHQRQPGSDRNFSGRLSVDNYGNEVSRDGPQHEIWNHRNYNVPTSASDLRTNSLPRNLPYSSLMSNADPGLHDNQQTFIKDRYGSDCLPYSQEIPSPQRYQQQHQQYQQQQQQQSPYQEEQQSHQQAQHAVDARLANPTQYQPYNLDYPSNSFNSLPRLFTDHQHSVVPTSHSQRDSSQFPQEDVVLRRSWAAASPARSRPDSRPHNVLPGDKPHSTGTERYSLDLGNIPQLQQQIRATSEMCLQASKRHVFASSADIYKLFQGQKKTGGPPASSSSTMNGNNLPRSRDHSNRHSFHAVPGASWNKSLQSSQHDPATQSREDSSTMNSISRPSSLISTYTPPSHLISSSPGPLRADHNIPIHQTAWTNNNLPPSVTSSVLSTLQVPVSETHYVQRQSSGYSSENELQQIELNAKAAKKTGKDRGEQQHSALSGIHPDQKFVPVDPSLDQDSSSSVTDNEPVYVNQPMLASMRASANKQPRQASPSPPPIPARPDKLQTAPMFSSSSFTLGQPSGDLAPAQNGSARGNGHVNSRPDSSPTSQITQNQVINLCSKPVTITSYVPHLSYSNTSNAPGQNADHVGNVMGGHILTLTPPELQPNQDNFHSGPRMHNNNNKPSSGVTRGSNSFNAHRSNGSPCVPLSPLELAQVLDVPFATNVISDESGDRLSTLV